MGVLNEKRCKRHISAIHRPFRTHPNASIERCDGPIVRPGATIPPIFRPEWCYVYSSFSAGEPAKCSGSTRVIIHSDKWDNLCYLRLYSLHNNDCIYDACNQNYSYYFEIAYFQNISDSPPLWENEGSLDW
jgi:hypothetical protein